MLFMLLHRTVYLVLCKAHFNFLEYVPIMHLTKQA